MRGTYTLSKHLQKKYEGEEKNEEGIDWKCIPQIKMGTGTQIFISSFSHQWLPLNKMLFERKSIGPPLCPMCNEYNETDSHFLCCK